LSNVDCITHVGLPAFLDAQPMLARASRSLARAQRSLAARSSSNAAQHRERRLVNLSPEAMYQVVADVAAYEHFVPWCHSSRVISRGPDESSIEAELSVSFGPYRESYVSKVSLRPCKSIRAVSKDTALFRELESLWSFAPAGPGRGCWVTLKLNFEFNSAAYQTASLLFRDEVAGKMVDAFELRCAEIERANAAAAGAAS